MYWARSGHLEFHQALGGDDERDLVGVAGDPVDPIDQGGDLGIGADLGDLLVATMHVSDDRLNVGGPLAVDLGDETKNAVGRWMLGPDVEGHVRRLQLDRDRRPRPDGGRDPAREPSGLRILFGRLIGPGPACPRRRPFPARV